MNNLTNEILKLKKEKNALILAHLYQRPEIQEIADIVGDSYFLSKQAMASSKDLIVFCGVGFMAESAKILSPEKRVLLPAKEARCPMADMATVDGLEDLKKSHPKAKVISYINTNLDIKANSDVCVTSSSALKILGNMEDEEIIFLPDRNLGEFISEHFPEKKFILYQGFCPIHERIEEDDITSLTKKYPNYEVLVHPECNKKIRNLADYIGSTSEIIDYSEASSKDGFIVVTEEGVLHQMKKKSPQKEFIPLDNSMICPNMKMTTLEELHSCLANESNEIIIDEDLRLRALTALENMHLLADK